MGKGRRIRPGGGARVWTFAAIAGALVLLATGRRQAAALETDQFVVPPQPLADIGPELAAEVMARIDAAAERVNARAAAHARKAKAARGFWRRHHLRQLEKQQTEGILAREVYRALAGPGLPECRIERWMRAHRFQGQPARFEMSCAGGAYGPSPLRRSPFLVSLSPTVHVFGAYFGADKVGHLFQQGYQYFDRFTRAEARGGAQHRESDHPHSHGDDPAALARAVRRGVAQERGFYGLRLVGVYSNADLAANYAGLKLYLNLTRPVRVGVVTRPPLFVRRDGQWARNPDAEPLRGPDGGGLDRTSRAVAFLRPFVSDHFNEALNPSRYTRPTRDTIRARWRQRAGAWAAFYGSTRGAELARLARLATWHGEQYGHSGFDGLVTAADTCFPAEAAPEQRTTAVAGVPRSALERHQPAAVPRR